MAKVSINITNLPAVTKAIREKLQFSLLPKLERNVRLAVAEKIKDILIYELRETKHYKGINGDYAGDKEWDIQAHMGLYDGTNQDFLARMEKVIREMIKVSVNNKGIGIRVSSGDMEGALLSLQGAEYTSHTSGISVPWLSWLLEKQGEVAAWIDFNIDHFNVESSRSERAIMHENNARPNWRVGNYAFGKQDNILIFEVVNNPGVLKRLEQLIRAEYLAQIKIMNGRGA